VDELFRNREGILMIETKVFAMDGKETGSVELPEDVFGLPMNNHVVWETVKMYQNNQRSGCHMVKNRAAAAGGGSKPYRQKGTGRARQGTIRAPHYVGGGVAFGPELRDYVYHVPKKIRRKSVMILLSDKVANAQFMVLDDLRITEPKTRHIAKMLMDLKISDQKVLLAPAEVTPDILLASRNISTVVVRPFRQVNALDIISSDIVVTTREVIENFPHFLLNR
jgi:large subunit ribosomal protein L4